MEVIFEHVDMFRVLMVKHLLKSHGIAVFDNDQFTSNAYGGTILIKYSISVPSSDFDKARNIILNADEFKNERQGDDDLNQVRKPE